ncbi:hypothetical protein [Microvirga pudoricolor]|uniref:hypothetical protein n=1 Tax=Microvirga pudoricolor TaxID=2778729 RepID=UPI00194DC518|nr:hypothetical protein [Microvirga pudoricolor]MBM6592631.1 hypothetical protein [Microvirga pudoricolor]
MTQEKNAQELRQESRQQAQSGTAFKPVALPALAAAVHASRKQPQHKKTSELPAILRKEAQLG